MVKNNIVQDQIINLMRLFPRHYQKMIKLNVDLMNDVDTHTNHIQCQSLNEKIYVYLNDIRSIPICKFCKINNCNFKNTKVGYAECCSQLCVNRFIPIKRKLKDPDTFSKSRIKQENTEKNTIDPISGLSLHKIKHIKAQKTKNTINPNTGITPNEGMIIKKLNYYQNNDHVLKGRSFDEYHGKEKADAIRLLISKNTSNAMLRVNEDGMSIAERINRKRVETMKADIDDNGLNAIQRIGLNFSKYMTSITDSGLSNAQLINRKRVETMKADIDDNGLNAIQRINKQNGKKAAKTLRIKFNKLILDKTQNAELYVCKWSDKNIFKVGWSINAESRIRWLSNELKTNLETILIVSNDYEIIRNLENNIHYILDNYNIVLDEKINGRTEWFKIECIQTCLSTISSIIGDLQ